MKKCISLLLIFLMLWSVLPITGFTAEKTSENPFAGKTVSILGDSISTYMNWSNGTAAQTTNTTIANGEVYYPRSDFSVTPESTWWYQLVQRLDMRLLVNNSWSGSCLLNTRAGTVGAYVDRCVQLHDNTGANAGEKPDIIGIFLGTNDYYTYPASLGSFETIPFDSLIVETENGTTYGTPATSMEAYAIILHKISQAYPHAEVYCMTLLPRVGSTSQPTAFNTDLYQLAEKFGVYVVDLYDCGIRSEISPFYMMMGDTLHPDNAGMDAMTNAFISTMLLNSKYMPARALVHNVSWTLDDVVAMDGTAKAIADGESYSVFVKPVDSRCDVRVKVTMGGVDITKACYQDGQISIPCVTGDLVIGAKAVTKPEQAPEIQRELTGFRWELQGDEMVNVTGNGNSANALTKTQGSIYGGVMYYACFSMAQTIYLNHDQPWILEWKSSGNWGGDGGLLFAQASTSNTTGARYLYRRHTNTMFALGYHENGNYHNYAVEFEGTGIDTTQTHVFRLANRFTDDGENMVWLYVDDVEVGPLRQYWYGATDRNTTSNWLAGKNFQFSYMGTQQHSLTNCAIEYIQVWEKDPHATGIFYICKADTVLQVSRNFTEAAQAAKEQGAIIRLGSDAVDSAIVEDGLVVDLAGHTLSGITVNGTIYGMDSAGDDYSAEHLGRLTLAAGSVAPYLKTTVDQLGSVRRYLAISEEDGYRFHRFYLGLRTVSLRPGVAGFGYKAVFCGDEKVKAALAQQDAFGFALWVTEDNVISRGMDAADFATGKNGTPLTLCLKNFDVVNHGQTDVYARVYITLADGTRIDSAEYACSMQKMLEQVNTDIAQYNDAQIRAVQTMLAPYADTVSSWNIADIRNWKTQETA